jgi:hypothetical protein
VSGLLLVPCTGEVHASAVISSLVEFEEATAFERWALAALVPLPTTRPHTAVKDLQANAVRVAVGTTVVRVYAGGVTEVHVDLRPLAFGAAWKVLDLLLELALSQAGVGSFGRVAIRTKVGHASKGSGVCGPLTQDARVWATLTGAYSATEQIRHSLVHRRAQVDQATGELEGQDEHGQALTPINADHQEAFCRAVQRAAHAALNQSISQRERADLAWNLDQLEQLHGRPLLGGRQMQPPPLGLARTSMKDDRALVNASALLDELRRNFPDRTAYDATFALPDGRHLLVELEQAPPTEVSVDLNEPPPWAQFWEGPSRAD